MLFLKVLFYLIHILSKARIYILIVMYEIL